MIDMSYIKELKEEIRKNLQLDKWTDTEETDMSILAEWVYLLDQRVSKLEEESKRRKQIE